jgi:beta-glucosidase
MRLASSFYLCLLVCTSLLYAQDNYDQRARDIVRQMTLDEKIQELHGIRSDEHYRYVPGVPRLGIPPFVVTNGPAGAGPGDTKPQPKATALPSPIALASTWDVDMARLYGQIAGAEARDIGNSLLEAPTINIVRVPQNGRTFEGYGEDPFLSGQLSISNIEGIQSEHEIANVKHWVANNQETDRFTIDERIDERTLHEIYLSAFEASILRGHSASVMCAYPKINGTYNCENDLLMNQILKKGWAYTGFITSDFGAVHSTVASAMAGLDLEMPTGKYWGDALKTAVESGQVPMSVIDDKLIRRFRTMMQFEMFDHSPSPKPIPQEQDGQKARQIAEAGIVLLKNTGGLLPLHSQPNSIAVIGPYAVKAVTGGGGSSHVVPLYTVDPADGIRKHLGPDVTVNVADGSDLQQAADAARKSEIAVVMVGEIDTEGRDHGLELPGNQDELIKAVAAANARTVVVLKTGSAVLMPWVDQVPAIVEAWYPGEEDGNAVADVLFGTVNPSGRLPITFPRRLEDLPAHTPEQYPGVGGVAKYSEGVFVGYRYYDQNNVTPLFPFGYGLSYTTFKYDKLRVSQSEKSPAANYETAFMVDFDVTNTGKVAGAEVAQVYIAIPSSTSVPEPPKQLAGFQRIELKPGEESHIRIPMLGRSLSYWDVNSHDWKVVHGKFQALVGASSRDIRLQDSFAVQ